MVHFKHVKCTVELEFAGKSHSVVGLQSNGWSTGDIWVCCQLFCKQRG